MFYKIITHQRQSDATSDGASVSQRCAVIAVHQTFTFSVADHSNGRFDSSGTCYSRSEMRTSENLFRDYRKLLTGAEGWSAGLHLDPLTGICYLLIFYGTLHGYIYSFCGNIYLGCDIGALQLLQ